MLALVVGCFASLTQTTLAAENSVYVIKEWVPGTMVSNGIFYTNGTSTLSSSTLMKLEDQYGNVIYAVCVDQKTTTSIGVKYTMVDLEDYTVFDADQKAQILAVLNYASTKYGLHTAEGVALAQTVIWRIIHNDIAYITPTFNVGITQREIDEVFGHRFDLAIDYNIPVTLQGTAVKVYEDATYAYYGP